MINQHIWQSIPADWPTNTPAYRSGLTDQPTYQPIPEGWLIAQHTWLYLLGLIDQPTCLNIYPSWLTDWHQLSVQVDWPTNILAYPSGLTDWPIHLTIWNDWSTNIPDYPGWQIDQQSPPFYLGWLTDWLTNIPDYLPLLKFVYCQCVVSCLPVYAYYPPSYKNWLISAFLSATYHHICLSIPATYQDRLTTHQCRLTDQLPVTYV